jgi:2-polyprenyl-3-methyl-5-hydroxy-6-metoxy-1,4-benzoquinol methylase
MERMMPSDIDLVLQREHNDRYEFVAPLLSGKVLDIACGIGYGGEIVMSLSNAVSYSGRDIDNEAVQTAVEHYAKDSVDFALGDITQTEFEDSEIDSAISFETLEHLEAPGLAVDEIFRILAPSGAWFGSVPTVTFDSKCESVYGENPYHLTRFTEESLYRLLSEKFEYVEIFFNQLLVSSRFTIKPAGPLKLIEHDSSYNSHGSLMFFASNNRQRLNDFSNTMSVIMPICSVVEYDEERVKPLRLAFDASEAMIRERDQLSSKYERTIDRALETIGKHEQTIWAHEKLVYRANRLESELIAIREQFVVKFMLKLRRMAKRLVRRTEK